MTAPEPAASRRSGIGPLDRVGVFSWRLSRLRHLREFLACNELVLRPSRAESRTLDAVVGWGHKRTARAARRYAMQRELPYLALEDGFLRSVGVGRRSPPLSLVLDDVGVYYDAHAPSRLERFLAGAGRDDRLADPALVERARVARARIVAARLSKYNHQSERLPPGLADSGRPLVLIADQTFGDASVARGFGSADTFDRMLRAALSEHPGARVAVKLHPVTLAGARHGYVSRRRLPPGVEIIDHDVSPVALLERVAHLYVCTSLLGFEALMLEKPVTCFGAPFYAGWGLTDDRVTLSRRGRRRSVDELVAAALLLYPRYVHPVTGERCEAEDVIEHLALQRRLMRGNAGRFYCFGFSAWKRPFVRRYLAAPESQTHFVRAPAEAERLGCDADSNVVVWASRGNPALDAWVDALGARRLDVEDGFLRSIELGSDLTPPGSLVFDPRGIYYDPRRPSELEHILEQVEFSAEELGRAARLRAAIVRAGISKYNPETRRRVRLGVEAGRRVVLVPGQVEDDASVRLGGASIASDADLLRAVRRARPDAHLVYKPHPDVVSGNRKGNVPGAAAKLWDQRVEGTSIDDCLAAVDEVHTLTSLVGFEALLRDLPVFVYGQPFYAGWGLTDDRVPLPRRRRRLTLDQLVAGTLLRYPRYYSFRARAFCTAEDKVHELAAERDRAKGRLRFRFGLGRKLRSLSVSALEWVRAR